MERTAHSIGWSVPTEQTASRSGWYCRVILWKGKREAR
uniref:Uncharacterized protein n=1 Tax=Proteus mirabilis TaxID=584 RepID=A0A411AND1_PROMI|nr:hypothetical protein 1_SGI1-O_022 [Proteus mirabilis]QAX89139.1 hypothetical protein SGI1-I_021 [Proteus mirabilis]QAX89188.1 hypothetical protein SGI1-PmCA14_021 [Proteus mirabilis]QAX89240.1 hypothetical protein SGI1-PmCA11_020 [Proteus mirabilis]QAX89280.1 hypothetical protein SGI1-PmCA46_021 [Proteus mirabilis]